MAKIYIDRYFNIDFDTDEILIEINDSDLVQAIIDRSITASSRGIFTLDHYDTDELLEELRQRNALPGVPKEITDILLKANQMLFEYNNGIFTPEEG